MAYYIFQKSLRSLEEFRKNPHVKIPPKSPFTNFQSLAIIKNQIFIRKRNFPPLSANSAQRPAGLFGLLAHAATRPLFPSSDLSAHAATWPPFRRSAQLARPRESSPSSRRRTAELCSEPPPRQAAMAAATSPTSPSLYGQVLPLLHPSHNRDLQSLFHPPFNPRRRPFPNSLPRCSGPLPPPPPAPIKGEHHPGLHRTSLAHSPPLPKPVLPGCRPPSPWLFPHRRPAATPLPVPR
jgi:hypothetical protein